MEKLMSQLHHCANNGIQGWGSESTEAYCAEQPDGRFLLLVNEEEFGLYVDFCPFCGVPAPKKGAIEDRPDDFFERRREARRAAEIGQPGAESS